MKEMRRPFWELEDPQPADISYTLTHGSEEQLASGIIRLALGYPHADLVYSELLGLVDHESENVRSGAIISIGHLVRRFKLLPAAAEHALQRAHLDVSPVVRGQADAAQDDVDFAVYGDPGVLSHDDEDSVTE